MRWAMKSWSRTRVLSRYLGGTLLPRLQLDLLPGLGCAAHVLLVAQKPPAGIDEHLRAGAAVQRFWLTATGLGLQHQPEMTPLIFSGYHRSGVRFTVVPDALAAAGKINRRLERLFAPHRVERVVWLGRVGHGSDPRSRSTRLALAGLVHRADPEG
jgi:hypothetical protein